MSTSSSSSDSSSSSSSSSKRACPVHSSSTSPPSSKRQKQDVPEETLLLMKSVADIAPPTTAPPRIPIHSPTATSQQAAPLILLPRQSGLIDFRQPTPSLVSLPSLLASATADVDWNRDPSHKLYYRTRCVIVNRCEHLHASINKGCADMMDLLSQHPAACSDSLHIILTNIDAVCQCAMLVRPRSSVVDELAVAVKKSIEAKDYPQFSIIKRIFRLLCVLKLLCLEYERNAETLKPLLSFTPASSPTIALHIL